MDCPKFKLCFKPWNIVVLIGIVVVTGLVTSGIWLTPNEYTAYDSESGEEQTYKMYPPTKLVLTALLWGLSTIFLCLVVYDATKVVRNSG